MAGLGGHCAAVPVPSALIDSHVPVYTRKRAYVNPTTGVVEGERTEIKLYNGSGDTVKGGVYRVSFTGTEETQPQIVDIAAAVTVDEYYVVSLKIVPDATFAWFAIQGYVDALVDGDTTDVTAGDSLKMTAATSANALTIDQADNSVTADTIAMACEGNTGAAALKKVYLLGDRKDAD